MQLSDMTAFLGIQVTGNLDIVITGINYDSRKVEPGNLFVCIEGLKSDGHDYAYQAVQKGASALLVQKPVHGISPKVLQVMVADTRKALALLSSFWFRFPSRSMRMIGVTGTNGKTTTTHLIKGMLERTGQRVGLIGTIHNLVGEEKLSSTHTTPESLELTALISRIKEMHSKTVVMEVSSHALKQNRVSGCEFDAAVFTNLTQDHLDYHLTWEDYLNSKLKLFQGLDRGEKTGTRYAVINADDPAASSFIDTVKVPVWTYGIKENASMRASDIRISSEGTSFNLVTPRETTPIHTSLTGMFNVYNVLAAVTVALAEGVSIKEIIDFLRNAPQVSGRFELVREGQPFSVIVDYAHTPDGLENILTTAREITQGRLITVFGCGGDRDRGKRPMMGRISGRHSDFTIVTSDNPRTEDPESIIAEIEPGISEVTHDYKIISDRRQAIYKAVSMAKPGDIVVIAGKGHETYQLVNGQTLHFDDRETAREALRSLGNGSEI